MGNSRKERENNSFTNRIGATTYVANVHFSETDSATLKDRLLHLVRNDVCVNGLPVAEEKWFLFSASAGKGENLWQNKKEHWMSESKAVTEEDIPKLIAFLKKQETNGRYFPKPCSILLCRRHQRRQMRGMALCHSLCRETKKGALIDRQRLSIPLRGRALCEAYAGALYRCYQNASMCYGKGYFAYRILTKISLRKGAWCFWQFIIARSR